MSGPFRDIYEHPYGYLVLIILVFSFSEDIGGVVRGCPIDYFTVPVTFKNEKGFVKLTGYEGSYSMNVSLEFR